MHSCLKSGAWQQRAIASADAAAGIARQVGSRLITVERIEASVAAAKAETRFPQGAHWFPHSVAQGFAGLAILYAYLDECFPGEGWDLLGRENLERAVKDAATYAELPLGIFSGLTGLAFATHQLSRSETRYKQLQASLDAEIIRRAAELAAGLHSRNALSVSDFDVISGLSGIGAYLLCRSNYSEARACLARVTEALVSLGLDGDALPRWYTPSHLLGNEKTRAYYRFGNMNLGLAHGIPGPLALLSLALREGICVNRHQEAIVHLAQWIGDHRLDDEYGINWPTAVMLMQDERPGGALRIDDLGISRAGPSRCAWCYGAPGIARALWLAGEAVDRDDFRNLALSAMRSVFRRPVEARQIDSPTFCHGIAGLLQIVLRFDSDVGGRAFSEEIDLLVGQILARYEPDSLLGFRNIEIDDHAIEQPGLLDGAPGVALALLELRSRYWRPLVKPSHPGIDYFCFRERIWHGDEKDTA